MKNETESVTTGGVFISGLTILFIALKLMGYIGWSWWWVLSPLWIPPVAGVAIVLVAFGVVVLVKAIIKTEGGMKWN